MEVECDGQRDRTKFIALNKFSNMDLSSDYKLLEEISRNIATVKKNFGKREDSRVIPPVSYRHIKIYHFIEFTTDFSTCLNCVLLLKIGELH